MNRTILTGQAQTFQKPSLLVPNKLKPLDATIANTTNNGKGTGVKEIKFIFNIWLDNLNYRELM